MGKLKKSAVAIGILLLVCNAWSDSVTLPFTFQNGQKADAVQVNSNFSALANAINGIFTRLASVESTLGPQQTESFTTTQLNFNVGDTVSVAGVSYAVRRYQIPNFDTDGVMTVDMPDDGNEIRVYTFPYFSGREPYGLFAKGRTLISGYPTTCLESARFRIYTLYNGTSDYKQSDYEQRLQCYVQLGASTFLMLQSYGGFNASSQPVQATTDPYATAARKNQRIANRDALRSLLRYVRISPAAQ